jgi:hypothetical protein
MDRLMCPIRRRSNRMKKIPREGVPSANASSGPAAAASSVGASASAAERPVAARQQPTDPQVAYIMSLCERLELDFDDVISRCVTKRLASQKIDELKRRLGWK